MQHTLFEGNDSNLLTKDGSVVFNLSFHLSVNCKISRHVDQILTDLRRIVHLAPLPRHWQRPPINLLKWCIRPTHTTVLTGSGSPSGIISSMKTITESTRWRPPFYNENKLFFKSNYWKRELWQNVLHLSAMNNKQMDKWTNSQSLEMMTLQTYCQSVALHVTWWTLRVWTSGRGLFDSTCDRWERHL